MTITTRKEWGLVRIDDRLIHGQVMAGWVRSRVFTRIHIVDDVIAGDPFMVDVFQMTAPAGLQVAVEDFNHSVPTLAEIASFRETMILMRTPETALRLFESGIQYDSLNIGGLGITPGRKTVYQNTSLSTQEYQILKKLSDQGVRVYFLSVPGEKSKDFLDLPEMS